QLSIGHDRILAAPLHSVLHPCDPPRRISGERVGYTEAFPPRAPAQSRREQGRGTHKVGRAPLKEAASAGAFTGCGKTSSSYGTESFVTRERRGTLWVPGR